MLKFLLPLLLLLLFSPSLSSSFQNKVVLITGGSSGIGYATTLLLAQKGAHIVFCARDSHPSWFNGSFAEQSITNDPEVKISGGSAIFFKADVRKIDEVRALIAFTHEKYGRIDYAVFSAGVSGYLLNLVDMADEDILTEHDPILANLYGVIHSIREQAKYWYKTDNKNQTFSIVVIASEAGLIGCPGCSMYSASKYGVIGIVKSAALEFINVHPKIRINAVCPGFVETPLVRNQAKVSLGQQSWEGEYIDQNNPLWPPFKADLEASIPGKRISQPVELARTIVSVLDNENSYLNGAAISVDDGGA